jgi:hypothetical protein
MRVKAVLEGPVVDAALRSLTSGTTTCAACGNTVRAEERKDGYYLVEHPVRAYWDGGSASVRMKICEASGHNVVPQPADIDGVAIEFEVGDDEQLAELERELNTGVSAPKSGHWRVERVPDHAQS